MTETRVKRILLAVLLAVGAFVALLVMPTHTDAAINPQINFQGKLTNPDGTNVSNGTYSIVFSLYTVASGGTAVWTETQSSVSVVDGIFQVSLGSVTALPGAVDFKSAGIYLGVKVGSDAEMTPRIPFTAAPYAFNASTADNASQLGGIASSGYVQLSPSAQQTGNINISGNITSASTGNNSFAGTLQSAAYLLGSGPDLSLQPVVGGQSVITSWWGLQLVGNKQNSVTYTPSNIGTAGQYGVLIPSQQAGSVALLLQGASGQTSDLLQVQDNSGAVLAKIDALGNITAAGLTVLDGSVSLLKTDAVNNKVVVGSDITDTNQVVFQLDSFDTFSDTAACGTTTNQGGLYYNTKSNAVRGCINGAWEDMISTASLGLQLFGVVPDSGTNPGDIYGVTGATNGPCKVYVGSTTSTVAWTGCTAFSGGRKVIVAAGTATTSNTVAARFQHLCLSGTNGQPVLSASGTETANLGSVSFPSASSPIVCLADIKFNSANSTISVIYDTRTYTTTDKTFVALNSAIGVGTITVYSATKGVVASTATASTTNIAGVIVATTGSASTTTINAVMATGGPTAVKSTNGTLNYYVFTSGTAGYASSAATKPAEGTGTIYNVLGNVRTAWTGGTACAVNSDACAGSIMTDIDKR